jgi:hypothetical protein
MARENRQNSDLDRSATPPSGIYNKNGLLREMANPSPVPPFFLVVELTLFSE